MSATLKTILLLAICFVISGLRPALADDLTFYVRAQGGLSQSALEDNDLRNEAGKIVGKLSQSRTTYLAYRLSVGANLTDYFSVELGYLRLGESQYDIEDSTDNFKKVAQVTSKAMAIDLVTRTHLPLTDDIKIFAVAGFASYTVNNDDEDNKHVSYRHKETAVRPEIGAGIEMAFTDAILLDASVIQIYGKGSPSSGVEKDMPNQRFFSVGLSYLFS